jgi:hypothetical protein
MKKNIQFIVLLILCGIILSSCQNKVKQKIYFWDASLCTPKNYPALIFSGHLILGDTPESSYVYMPFDRIINSEDLGDNDGSSSGEAAGISPKTINVTWMSFTENKTYSGIFKLDSEKIEGLMINGSERPYWDIETKKVGVVKDYDFTINTGLFPGGMIVLYVFSPSSMTIVGRYQAHEVHNVNWKVAFEQMENNNEMDEYVADIVSRFPPEIQNQIKLGTIPFGYWEKLFKKYHLTPQVKSDDKVETIKVNYINGEFESIFLSLNKNIMPVKDRAVPRKINIVWHDINDTRMETDIFFDEKKSMAIFEKIRAGEGINLVIEIDRNTKARETTGISIKLKTASSEIDMKEAIVSQESFEKPEPY